MNKKSTLPLLALALLGLVLIVAPLSKAQSNPTQPGIGGNGESSEDLKSYPFIKKTDFTFKARAVAAKLDTQITQLDERQAAETPAKPERAKALNEVKSARVSLEEKLGKLAGATAENWESARDDVIAALARLQASYDKAAAL